MQRYSLFLIGFLWLIADGAATLEARDRTPPSRSRPAAGLPKQVTPVKVKSVKPVKVKSVKEIKPVKPAKELRPVRPAKPAKQVKRVPFPPARPAALARPGTLPPSTPRTPAAPVAAPAEEGAAALSPCRRDLTPDIAIAPSLPPVVGPGACGVADPVRLEAVRTRDGRRINVSPPALLGCNMAAAVVHWVRDDVSLLVQELAGPLASLTVDAAFECRGRNRVAGAQISQHGLGNALDVRGFTLTDGKLLALTDPAVGKELRTRLQATACARFTTVLGPGADGYHDTHVHFDVIQRRGGYRICQWDVR